jgi:hypothetical protein
MTNTFGKVIDSYIEHSLPDDQYICSLYLYLEDGKAKAIINSARDDYEFTDIIFRTVDLLDEAEKAEAKADSLQDKIKKLERSKKDVEKAIKLLKGSL